LEHESSSEERYAALLAETRPGIIETPEEHERLLSTAERLMEKSESLAPEEERLLALLVFLIEAFEAGIDERDGEEDDEPSGQAEPPQPHETLQRLMQARKLEISDVEHLFGNVHLAREVLAGRRPISKGQAKELSKFFQVPAKLFQ
jgi:antitoxin component HigA of HigAB toxin-antitoxin module